MKKFKFKHFLRIYAGIFAIAILIVCIALWAGLKKYQKSYDTSKAAGDPQIFADELINTWGYDSLLGYVDKCGVEKISKYNTSEQIAQFYADNYSEVTAVKNEKYKDIMPIYDIYSGEDRIAVVSLKPLGENDDFGFHTWQVRDFQFDLESIDEKSYKVIVPAGVTVSVADAVLSSEEASSGNSTDDLILQKAQAISGMTFNSQVYNLGKCITAPTVVVTQADGTAMAAVEPSEEGTFDYAASITDDFITAVSDRVLATCDAYIMNIYSKLSFEDMCAYMEYNSDAYAVILDVQSSIAWGWKPDTVEIKEQKVSDYVKYTDNLFSCKYYGKIYKADSEQSSEETFNYSLLFRQFDGQWYLTYFVIE